MDRKISIRNKKFSNFFESNPDFDILSHDFFDGSAREKIVGSDEDVERDLDALRPYQRLMRLFPHDDVKTHREGGDIEAGVEALLARGFQSAHDIC